MLANFSRELDSFSRTSTIPARKAQKLPTMLCPPWRAYVTQRSCLVGTLGQEIGVLPQSFRQHLFDVIKARQHRTAKW